MLGICSFKWVRFLHENCLYLFLCKTMRQCYGRRRKDLGLWLYRWTTSEDCLVLGGWIVLNTWIGELCGVMKGVEKRIDEGVLWWLGHVKKMERERMAK